MRIGRKTYLVDAARGNKRTDYTAVGNTTIGLPLGAASSAVALPGPAWALMLLGAMGPGGTGMCWRLPEIE